MEFGALLCKPKSPDCMFCSLNNSCVAFQQNRIKNLPVKLKKLKRRDRYFNYLLFESAKSEYLFQQRVEKDIWQKLFEFPLIESKADFKKEDIFDTQIFKSLGLNKDVKIQKINDKTYKHVLTHQDIYADFWLVKCASNFSEHKLENYSIVNYKSIRSFAVPVLIDKFLDNQFTEI
jgi:A/G-specific adenine glycosylase